MCPILFGVEPSQLVGPLAHFQAAPFSREQILQFVQTVNAAGKAAGKGLSDDQLMRSFDRLWPELEDAIGTILAAPVEGVVAKRSSDDMIEEILATVRALSSTPARPPTANDAPSHWGMLITESLEFFSEASKKCSTATKSEQIDQLELILKHARFVLNLGMPKILGSQRGKEIEPEARRTIALIEKQLGEVMAGIKDFDEDDIPF